jgi:hypothetical protein
MHGLKVMVCFSSGSAFVTPYATMSAVPDDAIAIVFIH